MRRFFMVVLSLLAAGLAAQQPPALTMSWRMPGSVYPFRDARLFAYPVDASDFVVPLRVAYLGDLDEYVWQFRAQIPETYRKGDWILAGYANGLVVAQRFRITPGASSQLTPVPWPAPRERTRLPGQDAVVDYEIPQVDASVVARWEVVQDGQPVALDATGHGVGGVLNVVRVTGLRMVLVGKPKEHVLNGPAIRLEPDEGGSA